MLDKLMQTSLQNRLIVLLAALGVFVIGTILTLEMPIDVFPDLTAPTVTIMTEAHGMAPEEVEKLVTFPIETAVNGASAVRRVRSNSIQGLSTVWVEFDWGTDIYIARQIVNEKLQVMRNTLPEGVDQPVLAPITSIMGEIMLVGLTAEETSPMELRTLADFTVARRIQSVPGVSQVLVYGGETQQYQVQVDPYKVASRGLTLDHVLKAVAESNINATGGVFVDSGQEYLIRGLGRVHNVENIEHTVVSVRDRIPVMIKDVADVEIAPAFKLGAASINNEDGVLLVVAKQPEANTLTLTEEILDTLKQLEGTLPQDITMHTDVFRQADFIEVAVDNVVHALRDGAILVTIILFFFLLNVRTTLISVLAIPLSLVTAFLAMRIFGLSINTMTLGGMAIAIGVLVDDAIIYVENVYRRVRQNACRPPAERRPFKEVVAAASSEIRTPIAMATFIVIVVFIPLFFLGGIEGRMLKPLGFAYAVSILASLLVAVTVTPALSSFLLRNVSSDGKRRESWLVRKLKSIYEPSLRYFVLKRRGVIIGVSALLVIAALASLPLFGRAFLPEFNEGTFNISLATLPGTSLKESDELGSMVETILLSNDAVVSTARRTGRTELDEHSLGSHAHELEVRIDLSKTSKAELLKELRRDLALVPGTNITIGQPISHRIDHMLSGTRAAIAVKLYGPDLYELRRYAEQIRQEMAEVEGLADLFVDQQTDVPQVRIQVDRERMSMYGLRSADLDELIDVAFLGAKTSQVYEGEHRHDLVVRYAPQFRADLRAIRKTLIDTPGGGAIPLEMVADIREDRGPNYISRENVQRKIVIQANVAGRDLRGAVEDIQEKIESNIELPQAYFIEYGGQFESEERATRTVMLLSIISIIAILITLYIEFGSFRQATLVMINLPLALIGGIVSVFFTEGIISIASLVGFITLFGIAVRNGILMVSHYYHLIDEENLSLGEAVIQGSMERLSPILMTAMTTGLALVPLALAGDKPGSELQSPMAVVILGGLVTATFLNLVVVPALFMKWGRKA
ncbi:MAG: CusA/CzcA family heavy metal efflux RND transporter [Candidatus Eisenbacteria bacterium]|nr:CusA/CzcA family heavy metal efflux RND transporter [Candidatus Eisenbacteria bacterium]